jgi:hypothetical protein
VPQHTTAERRHAAAERQHQREAEQRKHEWLRRATGPMVATIGAAAAGVIVVTPVATADIWHFDNAHWAASEYYLSVPMELDHPDYPHMPEPDQTFYSVCTTAGTAAASMRYERGPQWDPWEWARGLMHDD